jgi:hypothetical protein
VSLRYKFIELSVVTEQTIEDTVNEWVSAGWQLEGIRFVTTEHSRRPAMAYVSFIRYLTGPDEVAADRESPRTPPRLVKDP